MEEQVVPGMAEAVEARRLERGLSPGEFARAASLTGQGLVPVRRGYRRAYQDVTLRGVAKALAWRLDWYERLAEGADPASLADERADDLEERVSRLEAQWDRIEALIEQLEAQAQAAQ